MPGKIIQISAVKDEKGLVVLFALDEHGQIYEKKMVGVKNAPWSLVS